MGFREITYRIRTKKENRTGLRIEPRGIPAFTNWKEKEDENEDQAEEKKSLGVIYLSFKRSLLLLLQLFQNRQKFNKSISHPGVGGKGWGWVGNTSLNTNYNQR